MKRLTDQEIRDRITPGVREYLHDRFGGARTLDELELDVDGIVEGVVESLNTPVQFPFRVERFIDGAWREVNEPVQGVALLKRYGYTNFVLDDHGAFVRVRPDVDIVGALRQHPIEYYERSLVGEWDRGLRVTVDVGIKISSEGER